MRFPNAAKGMKKIFRAQILDLIGTILMVVAAGLIVVAIAAGSAGGEAGDVVLGGTTLGAVILFAAFSVLSIIAFIMNLVGIINASHDESNFKSALFFLVFSIIAAVIAGIFYNNGTVYGLMYSLSNLLKLFVTIFIISGGVKLADQMNRGDVSATGSNVLKLIIVIAVLGLVSSLIASITYGKVSTVVVGVLMIVAFVLAIVQYFMYLVFLNKVKNMLNK